MRPVRPAGADGYVCPVCGALSDLELDLEGRTIRAAYFRCVAGHRTEAAYPPAGGRT